MLSARRILVLSFLVLSACPSAPPVEARAEALSQAPGYRSLAFHWNQQTGVALVKERRVAGALQRLKVPLEGPWRVDVLAADGTLAFTTQLAAPNVVRADSYGQGTPALVRQPEAAFLVNLPLEAQGTLQLWAQRWTLADDPSTDWVKLGELPLEAP